MWEKYKALSVSILKQYRWWVLAQVSTLLICIGLVLWLNINVQAHYANELHSKDDNQLRKEPIQVGKQTIANDQHSNLDDDQRQKKSLNKSTATGVHIYVDVKGAVKKPGIYQMQPEQRIDDALGLAGGITPTADLTMVNRAAKVTDELIVYVPQKGEQVNPQPHSKTTAGVQSTHQGLPTSLINLNQASETELMTLPNVGAKRAQDIIDYRSQQAFQKTEDLGRVPGIGPKLLEKLLPLVTT